MPLYASDLIGVSQLLVLYCRFDVMCVQLSLQTAVCSSEICRSLRINVSRVGILGYNGH